MPTGLERHFRRRMAPLAAAAGLVVAVVPPLFYSLFAWQKQRAQADLYARHIAEIVRRTAERQPYLWPYVVNKHIAASALGRIQTHIGRVRILDCAGHERVPHEVIGIGSGGRGGPLGRASARARGREVARVEVMLDAFAERRTLLDLALASTLIGLLLGTALHRWPTRTVRRQAAELARVLDRLAQAERELRDANRDLSRRVAEGLAELRQLSARLVGTQEEERRRIARDLHDGVGQLLTALRLELELLPSQPARLGEAVETARKAMEELRAAIWDLRPPELDGSDIAEVLRSATERFERRSGIAVSFRQRGPTPRVPDEIATCLLRLLQEALTNVRRHAGAGEVGVLLSFEPAGEGAPARVVLEVSDDGRGFAPGEPARPGASGLRGMRERCAFFGGTLEVDARPREGVKLRATVPLGTGAEGA